MALQNLHEMIRNLSAYIKNLESLCENGIRLAKNFERLLSPGPVVSSQSPNLDADLLAQNATWELAQKIYQCWTTAHKYATLDSNAMISEILPLLQEAVQNAMKDPEHSNSSNTYEGGYGGFPRTPDLARSPTTVSFSSSGDRRESTESCMSSFSLPFSNPRSSISGLSALSSRSTSPSPMPHHHHYGHHNRSARNSSPSVKFTPSQPPSPYGDYAPYLFRRWSAHTHNYGNNSNNSSSLGSGPSVGSSLSGQGNYSSSGSIGSGLSSGGGNGGGCGGVGRNDRRWSVPASSGMGSSSTCSPSPFKSSSAWKEPCSSLGIIGYHTDSTRRSGGGSGGKDILERDYDYGLLDVINLLSSKPMPSHKIPLSPADLTEETIDEFCSLENNTTSLWPPSDMDNLPEIVLTSCPSGHDPETIMSMESLQRSSQSLRVPFSGGETPMSPSNSVSSISGQMTQQSGEYSLFPINPSRSPTQGT